MPKRRSIFLGNLSLYSRSRRIADCFFCGGNADNFRECYSEHRKAAEEEEEADGETPGKGSGERSVNSGLQELDGVME